MEKMEINNNNMGSGLFLRVGKDWKSTFSSILDDFKISGSQDSASSAERVDDQTASNDKFKFRAYRLINSSLDSNSSKLIYIILDISTSL